MKVNLSIFRTPKNGNTEDEYEDAYYPVLDGEYEGQPFFAAVADGASEGFLSAQWAEMLVRQYCDEHSHRQTLASFITETEALWKDFLAAYIHKREQDQRPVQWYEEPGLANGAFSTLAGLSIFDGPQAGGRTWAATAVGDTCLFQVRRAELIGCFPMQTAEAFNTWPALISSNPAHNKNVVEKSQHTTGTWEDGDQFLLMSDAISAWFLREHEAGRQPWRRLRQSLAQSDAELVDWIGELREKNEMRNDDVTLMSLSLSTA